MDSHLDRQHDITKFMGELQGRAAKARKNKTSQITTGKDGEKPLGAWKGSNGVHVKHMPDDEQGILRISCGGGDHLPVTMNYLTIRGGVGQCIELLEKAIVALRECPE